MRAASMASRGRGSPPRASGWRVPGAGSVGDPRRSRPRSRGARLGPEAAPVNLGGDARLSQQSARLGSVEPFRPSLRALIGAAVGAGVALLASLLAEVTASGSQGAYVVLPVLAIAVCGLVLGSG